jgi:hypothetical protein
MLPATSKADLRPSSYQAGVHRLQFGAGIVLLVLAACSAAPSPSHVSGPYRGKLNDDVLFEAATTVLVTNRDVVMALDCADSGEAAIAAGRAVRLPARVTLYTPELGPDNPPNAPTVVTDDKFAGRLCTPDSYDVVKR